jgi:hypothetical protein
MRRRIVQPPALGIHSTLTDAGGSEHDLLNDEKTASSSTTTNNKDPTHGQESPKRRNRDTDLLSFASNSSATVGLSMLVADTIVPPPAAALRDDSGRLTRRDLPAVQQHQGYHQPAASDVVLREIFARQALADSARRRLVLTNSSSLPSTGIGDSLYYLQSSSVPALHSSLLYNGIRGAPPSLLAPPNTAPGISGEQYPSPIVNTDPRLSQLLLSALPQIDLSHQALLYQSSLLGGEVDPYRSIYAAYGTQPPGVGGVGGGILQDHILAFQQGRFGSTTTGLLQHEFANPYLVYQNMQPGNTSAHSLLAAAQRRSALLAAAYPPLPPARLPQEGGESAGGSLAFATSDSLSLRQRANSGNAYHPLTAGAGGGSESFPMVLHRALADLEVAEGGPEIATYLPDGKSFVIRNQFLFQERVLPVFFPKMKSFASFQRQLNLYDFNRMGGAGADRGAYHHHLFVRQRPDDVIRMKRTKLKGGTRRGPLRVHNRSPSEEVFAGEQEAPSRDQPTEGKSEE